MILLPAGDMIVVLLLCLLLEYMWGDPQSAYHPVALFGSWAGLVERLCWQDKKFTGVLAWILTVSMPFVALFLLLEWLQQSQAYVFLVLQAVLLWMALGWKSLLAHVRQVSHIRNIKQAQQQVGKIVGRNTTQMGEQDIRRASLESLAENSSDAIIAPLFWFALFGGLGAWIYRMINTLDAMWGYKNKRYLHFGWCAAKMDDAWNIVPARLTALLLVLQHPRVCSRQLYQQARQHLSPNAGYPETSLAFVLGVRLGGSVLRGDVVEQRAWMGVVEQAIKPQHIRCGMQYVNRAVFLMLGIVLLMLGYGVAS